MSKLLILLTLAALLLVPWGLHTSDSEGSEVAPGERALARLRWLSSKQSPGTHVEAASKIISGLIDCRSQSTMSCPPSRSLTLPAVGLFDGVTVDVATVTVGGDALDAVELVDLNGDGILDLVISYDAALVDSSGSVQVCAQGDTTEGVPVEVCGDMQVSQP